MPVPNTNAVAVDLGAESCRVSLLRWTDGRPDVKLLHRFPNGPVQKGDHLYWDINHIYEGISHGLKLCAHEATSPIASIGVDGWGVDYARLRPDGRLLGDPFCHRDERTIGARQRLHQRIAPQKLYELTGIQLLPINTIYQLYADQEAGIPSGAPWVQLPEYITMRLGAERFAEYTNVTHSGLVRRGTKEWCSEIFEAVGLGQAAAPPIVSTGVIMGPVVGDLANLPHLGGAKLVATACHDTASAVAAIADDGDDWAFISSGTWSLVGVLLDTPCISSASFDANFTNLGAAGNKICFLKNVNGMWILRQCMEEWQAMGYKLDVGEVVSASEKVPTPGDLLNVDDPAFMTPGNMLEKMNSQLRSRGCAVVRTDRESVPIFASLIFHSLGSRYAALIKQISSITGKRIRRIHIVGGGSKNKFLNQLTAAYSGLEVLPGAPESSTLGNFAVQMAALEEGGPPNGVSHRTIASWAQRTRNGLNGPLQAA